MIMSGQSKVAMPQFVRITFHSVNRLGIGVTVLAAVIRLAQPLF